MTKKGRKTLILTLIINKLQGRCFGMKMKIHSLLKLPAQTKKERRIFKLLFDLSGGNEKLRIFEWGSGYSTLYYSQYLLRKGVDFEWHSIDNDRAWHDKVMRYVKEKKLQSRVNLHLQEFNPFWEKTGWNSLPPPCGAFSPRSENEMNYVNFPHRLNGSFDVIIVDARFRRHCIQTAKDVLRAEGVVVLHDAQKSHYQRGLDNYPFGRFIESGVWFPLQKIPNRVWIGCLNNHPIFERLKALKK